MTTNQWRLVLLVAIYLPVALLVADYLAGVLFYVANKTIPMDLSLWTWPDAWDAYHEDPVQRRRLQVGAAIGLSLVILLPGIVWLAHTNRRPSLHGDARFASRSEIRKAGLFGTEGIVVGKEGRRFLLYPGQEFVLVAAPTRSGKGVSIVIPNLLNFHGSVVVLDVKMENFAYTSRFRSRHGQEVFLFNPFADDFRTHRWNPLDGVSRSPQTRVGDIQTIAQVLYPTEHVKESFWSESARNLFLGLTLYLLETPTVPCTLGELLRQASGNGTPLKDYLSGLVAQRSKGDDALSVECRDALQRFYNNSDNTLASILATFVAPLTIFSNPIVDAATSATDIRVEDVRRKRMSIYVGIPPNRLSEASLLVNLFFSQLIHKNTQELPAKHPALRYQCLLVLDEFAALGRVDIIAKSVGFLAGYNLRLLPIVQSLSQLQGIYGEREARTLVTNHGCQVIFAPQEQSDAEAYSRMLGTYTATVRSTGHSQPRGIGRGQQASRSTHESEQARPLLLPQELRQLGEEKAIVQVRNGKPILCNKARFYDDANFLSRLRAISPSLAQLKNKRLSQAELEQAALVLGELSVDVPRLDVEQHRIRVEQRRRPLQSGEPIEAARVAVDLSQFPRVTDDTPPDPQYVSRFVDAYFDQLGWIEKEPAQHGSESVTGDEPELELDGAAHTPDATGEPGKDQAGRATVMDLSVLERE
jgi:type IV secretion system protein VirD4